MGLFMPRRRKRFNISISILLLLVVLWHIPNCKHKNKCNNNKPYLNQTKHNNHPNHNPQWS